MKELTLTSNDCRLLMFIFVNGGEIDYPARTISTVLGLSAMEVRTAKAHLLSYGFITVGKTRKLTRKLTNETTKKITKKTTNPSIVATLSLSASFYDAAEEQITRKLTRKLTNEITNEITSRPSAPQNGQEKERTEKENFPPHPLYKEKENKEKEKGYAVKDSLFPSLSPFSSHGEKEEKKEIFFEEIFAAMKQDEYWVAQVEKKHVTIDDALEQFKEHIITNQAYAQVTDNAIKMRTWFNRAARYFLKPQIELGCGEYMENGKRHYKVGAMVKNVPLDAPPRPSFSHGWHLPTQTWKYNPDY